MTQPDGGQSPYDPPQQPQQPEQGQPAQQPGAAPGEPSPYQQDPYQQAPYQQAPYQQAPQAPAYAQGGQPYAYGGAPMPKNSLGVWSLVLGILAVLGCGLITGIAAIITGHKSRKAQQEGLADNGGMGLAGIITGWVGIAWTTIYVIIMIFFVGMAINDPSFQDSFEQELESGYSENY
ncbi:DUF4190 domain-containing protein [Promicromonospora vindobonensis]|uniref:DUF4190 domain-containing protein n=1 Tax=Promicromonospora vindobonensis TaxID=195748 RepID=A0ABW5VUY0_9MICO